MMYLPPAVRSNYQITGTLFFVVFATIKQILKLDCLFNVT